ncbi:hypothetical protein HK405_007230 [Cladochytrium tenue]|nr:hypothetical protein HK405_007230 [Cladochytrium tenue]
MLSKDPVYNPDGSYDYSYTLYGTKPSKTLAFVAAAVFLIAGLLHLGQSIKLRTWYMAPAIVGCALEVAGYLARTQAIDNPFSTKLYAIQQVLIVIAPVLVAATQYIVLEKIMEHVDPKLAPIRPSLVAKVFVGSDIVSFVVQGGGSGLMVGSASMASTGTNVLLGGLGIQILSFSAFLIACFIYYHRASVASGDPSAVAYRANPKWRLLFLMLAVGSAAVLTRSIYRVVEFAEGYLGPIATNETYLYVLDALLMALATVLLNVVHPGVALRSIKHQGGYELGSV